MASSVFFLSFPFLFPSSTMSSPLHNNNIMDVRMLLLYMVYTYYTFGLGRVKNNNTRPDDGKTSRKKNTSWRQKHSISKTIAHITFNDGTIRLLIFPLETMNGYFNRRILFDLYYCGSIFIRGYRGLYDFPVNSILQLLCDQVGLTL